MAALAVGQPDDEKSAEELRAELGQLRQAMALQGDELQKVRHCHCAGWFCWGQGAGVMPAACMVPKWSSLAGAALTSPPLSAVVGVHAAAQAAGH